MKKMLWNTLLAIALTLCTMAFFSCEIIELDLEGAATKEMVKEDDNRSRGESD